MKMTPILLAATLLLGTAATVEAQVPYQNPPPGWSSPAQAYPQAWSYDPYTSGIGACVQKNWGNSPPCKYFMEPTYGQPNYWQYH